MDAEWVLLDEWEGVSQILTIFLAVSTVPVQINWFLSSCPPSFPTSQNLSVAYLFLQNAFYAHYHLYPLVVSLQLACPAVLPMFHLMRVLVSQLCPALCDTMDCSPPGISVHGILQARILEWVAIPFSRGASRSRDQTWVSHIAGSFFTICATREAHVSSWLLPNLSLIHSFIMLYTVTSLWF